MVIESVTVALLASLLGLVIAHWSGEIIHRTLLPEVAWSAMPVDSRVLLWTAIVTVVAGVVVGLIPAARVSGGDVASALRGGQTGVGSGGASHGVARASLQVVQLALSLVLLFIAGLFVKSLQNIEQIALGYDRDRVLAVDISFPRPDSVILPRATCSRRKSATRTCARDLNGCRASPARALRSAARCPPCTFDGSECRAWTPCRPRKVG